MRSLLFRVKFNENSGLIGHLHGHGSVNHLALQLLVGGAAVTSMVVYHVSSLVLMSRCLAILADRLNFHCSHLVRAVAVIGMAGMFILLVHISEIWLWAILFIKIGAIDSLEAALYYSTVTATTVGYGDVVPDQKWRLLGSFEAMAGIIAFGISTAFLISVIREFLQKIFERKS